MTTTPAPSDRSDQQFLDLICYDQDLLEAEFDAIIAAEWPTPPADRAQHRLTGGPGPKRSPGRAGHRLGVPTAGHGAAASAGGSGNVHRPADNHNQTTSSERR
jgi:hypothetical protein